MQKIAFKKKVKYTKRTVYKSYKQQLKDKFDIANGNEKN